MSVKGCHRNGCNNIMCSRCSGSEYICNECFDELVGTGPTTDIKTFMNSEKKGYDSLREAEARYNAAFPLD